MDRYIDANNLMERFICAEKLLKTLATKKPEHLPNKDAKIQEQIDYLYFKLLIEMQPTADVVKVKHGCWIHSDKAEHWRGKDECSECHYHTDDRRDLSHFKYCPECGAKMDGGTNDL